MAQYNQRSQPITGQQYNAQHDISFKEVQNTTDLSTQLERLRQAVVLAAQQGLLSEETSIDAEAQLKKALVQAKKPIPQQDILLDHLTATRTLIETSTKASGLIPVVVNVIETVQKSFS